VERGIWLNDKGEWKLRFFQETVSGWNGIDSRTHILGWAVCIRGRCEGSLEKVSVLDWFFKKDS